MLSLLPFLMGRILPLAWFITYYRSFSNLLRLPDIGIERIRELSTIKEDINIQSFYNYNIPLFQVELLAASNFKNQST